MSSARARRPAWIKEPPDVELDIREFLPGDGFCRAIMEGLDRLGPGRVLGIRTDFEPTLLYSILGAHGFEHWAGRGENGDWNLQIRRRPVV
ncbi:MAG: hypothetical protein A2V88_12515 [Elusimicrobia bacterium RBG_16_66_12]|nr:MAG: hypothetical protein A2V88_12515 [Elusimicrobia bacterium RBG_16_66_12]